MYTPFWGGCFSIFGYPRINSATQILIMSLNLTKQRNIQSTIMLKHFKNIYINLYSYACIIHQIWVEDPPYPYPLEELEIKACWPDLENFTASYQEIATCQISTVGYRILCVPLCHWGIPQLKVRETNSSFDKLRNLNPCFKQVVHSNHNIPIIFLTVESDSSKLKF